jgi:hypothetical protein
VFVADRENLSTEVIIVILDSRCLHSNFFELRKSPLSKVRLVETLFASDDLVLFL